MLYWLADFSAAVQLPERLPLHHLPHRRRDGDGAVLRVLLRPAHHRQPAHQAGQGPADPRRTGRSPISDKKGTPTMGGLMILSGLIVSTLLWANLQQPLCLGRAAGHARLRRDRLLRRLPEGDEADATRASPARSRLLIEALIAGVACYRRLRHAVGAPAASRPRVALPFFKDVLLDLGIFFAVFGAFVIVGAGNAVNLTDGLDGLAIVPVMIAARDLRLHRLPRRATRSSPTICRSTSCPAPANSRWSAAR